MFLEAPKEVVHRNKSDVPNLHVAGIIETATNERRTYALSAKFFFHGDVGEHRCILIDEIDAPAPDDAVAHLRTPEAAYQSAHSVADMCRVDKVIYITPMPFIGSYNTNFFHLFSSCVSRVVDPSRASPATKLLIISCIVKRVSRARFLFFSI